MSMSRFTVSPDQLREALETLALDPRALGAPDVALSAIRPVADAARATAEAERLSGGDAAARDAGLRVFDAAAAGLLVFARAAIQGDTSLLTAPLAIIGTGTLGLPESHESGRRGVLFVLGKRALTRMRGRAVARFVANGLALLGFAADVTVLSLVRASELANRDPRFCATLRTARFIDGRYDLFQRLPGTPPAAGIAAA
jgi:hypothetical protein